MKILKNIFVYFIIVNLFFTAPLRFLFSFVLKLDFLNYLLNTIFILSIIFFKWKQIGTVIAKNKWVFSYFLIVIFYSLLFENFKVVIYFFYILLPFAFFSLYYKQVLDIFNNSKWLFIIVFILCTGGIVYDYFFDFPWKSLSYTIGGNDIDFAKDSTYNGAERIAGFARSSFDAALGLLFLLIMIIYRSKNGLLNQVLFITTFATIYITTVKSCLITLLLIYIIYMGKIINQAVQKRILMSVYLFLSVFIVILPLGILQDFQVPILNNESLRDRINNTWPFIVNEFHTIFDYILGTGIGSVGGGQQVFGILKLYSPGDNFFIFIYPNLGIISLSVFYLGYIRVKKIYNPLFRYMLVILFSYGITSNMIESILGQLIIFVSLFIPFNSNSDNDEMPSLIKGNY